MKIFPLLVAGSLIGNAVLIALIVAGAGARDQPTSIPPSAAAATVASAPAVEATPGAETWTALKTGDLAAQRDRLQSEGFPPSLVRSILAAQIREGFAARRKQLEAAQANAPFWKPINSDPKALAGMRALSLEEQKTLRELLGPDPENGVAASLRRQFPNFAPEKIDQLAAIRERYEEQRQNLYSGVRGPLAPDEQEKIAALEKTMRSEFAAVLTPQEFEEYELRTSNIANNLRYNLVAFEPTEAEFRALFRLQSAFDEQYRTTGPLSQDQMRARSEAQKQFNDQIAAALGPDRYADYQRANDYNYRQTTQLVARLALPVETANQVYAIQKEIEQRRSPLYGRDTTPEQRNAQLATLAAEAQSKITAVLGARGFEAYKQYGGQWLQNLQPRPAAPPDGRGGGR